MNQNENALQEEKEFNIAARGIKEEILKKVQESISEITIGQVEINALNMCISWDESILDIVQERARMAKECVKNKNVDISKIPDPFLDTSELFE